MTCLFKKYKIRTHSHNCMFFVKLKIIFLILLCLFLSHIQLLNNIMVVFVKLYHNIMTLCCKITALCCNIRTLFHKKTILSHKTVTLKILDSFSINDVNTPP